ncbi:MAG: cupin domain-containing protein [Elusimicrobia bacterium]|nr:cupin domain-containing protein [Elusimicrobiota bacterium]
MKNDEVLVKLERPFIDERGAIRPLVERVMKSALIIDSRKGAVRGNHFHKTDWHYCYVVSGTMYYFHRDNGSLAQPEKVIVKAGSMVFTPPMVDHAMRFPEDTVFLTLSRNPRDQTAYEKDVIRVELLK